MAGEISENNIIIYKIMHGIFHPEREPFFFSWDYLVPSGLSTKDFISYLWASPYVLITTDTKTEIGDDLEFNTMDEVLKKANAIL